MNNGTFKIATVGGIDVKAHWGWVLVLFLFTYQLASDYFPTAMPNENGLVYFGLGLSASLLLFASVLLHEFAHSFVAKARGYSVRDITLLMFGGVSNIEGESKKASDEFLIAVVGPLTSFLLAGLFYGLEQVVNPPLHRAGAGAAATLHYLALINFLLALFNMIPGFPLDGGRVLRSIIWAITRNPRSATRFAGYVGQFVAYGFILWGVLTVLRGDFFGGAWIGFIGWFLLNAAQQSVSRPTVSQGMRGVSAGQLMEPSPPAARANMTIAHLLTQFILAYNLRAVPVLADDGRIAGIVTLSDIRDIPQDQWGTVTVGQVMTGPDKLRVVHTMDGLERVLQLLGDGQIDQLPVVDAHGIPIGMLNRANVLRWVHSHETQQAAPPPTGA